MYLLIPHLYFDSNTLGAGAEGQTCLALSRCRPSSQYLIANLANYIDLTKYYGSNLSQHCHLRYIAESNSKCKFIYNI